MWSPSAERFALLSRTAIYVYSSTVRFPITDLCVSECCRGACV